MVLELGVNSGFVTTAPTADPGGTIVFIVFTNSFPIVSHAITPSNAVKITEVGWWVDDASDEADWKMALYAADGSVVPNEAGTRLFITSAQAKGTGAGWKRVSVDWNVNSSTEYWIGAWLAAGDNTFTVYSDDGGGGSDAKSGELTDPFGAGEIPGGESTRMHGFYALIEESTGFTRKIKIGGSFVDKPIKIKVGGSFVDKPIKIKVGGTFQDT